MPTQKYALPITRRLIRRLSANRDKCQHRKSLGLRKVAEPADASGDAIE